MSRLSRFISIVQELSEASRSLIEVDTLREEKHGDPAFNRMMDRAVSRLDDARSAFEDWESGKAEP